MKKIISILLVVLFLVNYVPVHAEESYTDPDTKVTFVYEENVSGGLTITDVYYYEDNTEYGSINLVIPKEINGVPVTVLDCQIDSNYFYSVMIPANVEEIFGDQFFTVPLSRINRRYLGKIYFADNSKLKKLAKSGTLKRV